MVDSWIISLLRFLKWPNNSEYILILNVKITKKVAQLAVFLQLQTVWRNKQFDHMLSLH